MGIATFTGLFMKRKLFSYHRACVLMAAAVPFLCCNQVEAVPTTEIHITGLCSSEGGLGFDDQFDSTQFQSYSVGFSDHTFGISNQGEFSGSDAAASVSFFRNFVQVSVGIDSIFQRFEFGHATTDASYALTWSDGVASGNIVGPLGGNPVFGNQGGTLQFVYGTSYTIQSSLTAEASAYNKGANGADASAKSVWTDTFTFHGQPDGSAGVAFFMTTLGGSFKTESILGPTYSAIESEGSVSGALRLGELPSGSWLETGSGTRLPSIPDAGSSGLLLGIALSAMAIVCKINRTL